MSPRPSLRRASALVASLGLVLGLVGASASPVAAVATSAGCLAWDAYGPDGVTTSSTTVDGPFLEGDVLKFSIDAANPDGVSAVLSYAGQTENTAAVRGPMFILAPVGTTSVGIAGTDGSGPATVILKDFECVPAEFGPGPNVSIEKAATYNQAGIFTDPFTTYTDSTVWYRIRVVNTGDVPLTGLTLTDDSVDLAAQSCLIPPTLASHADFTCTYSTIAAEGTSITTATVHPNETAPASDSATVVASAAPPLPPTLHAFVDSNAPLVYFTEDHPPRGPEPTVDEGAVVTFTIRTDMYSGPLTNARIKVLFPALVPYVPESATGTTTLPVVGFDAGTRTLSWAARDLSENQSVRFKVKVRPGAGDLHQPRLLRITLDSNESDAVVQYAALYVRSSSGGVVVAPPTDVAAAVTSATRPPPAVAAGLVVVLGILAGAAVLAWAFLSRRVHPG